MGEQVTAERGSQVIRRTLIRYSGNHARVSILTAEIDVSISADADAAIGVVVEGEIKTEINIRGAAVPCYVKLRAGTRDILPFEGQPPADAVGDYVCRFNLLYKLKGFGASARLCMNDRNKYAS